MSDKESIADLMKRKFGGNAERAEKKAGRLYEGQGGGYHDAVEIPGRHPAFPANPQPATSWDSALDSNRGWEGIVRKEDLK